MSKKRMSTELYEFFGSEYHDDSIVYDVHDKREAVSCDRCKGSGYISRDELTNYHKREVSTYYDRCKACEGEGRLTRRTKTLSISANYPIPSMQTQRVTEVPWSKDPVDGVEYGESVRGALVKRRE